MDFTRGLFGIRLLEKHGISTRRTAGRIFPSMEARTFKPSLGAGPLGYAEALLFVAASTLVGHLIAPSWGNSAVDQLYLPAVLAAAALRGLGPALLAAIASALAYNFFFTEPYHTFVIHSPSDVVTVIVLFLVALVTSHLASSIREQAKIAEALAARNATIAGLARKLLTCTSESEIAELGASEIAGLFDCNATVLAGLPAPHVLASRPPSLDLTPSDTAVAAVTLETGDPSGRGASRPYPVEWQFRAIRSGGAVLAAIGLARDDGEPPVAAEQIPLLENLLDQLALALERVRFEAQSRDLAALKERDRIRSALLASMGRDVGPRFAAMKGAVAQLRRAGTADKAPLSALSLEATKLERYIANLVELGPDSVEQPVEIGGVTIDLARRSISRDGRPVHLTPKEFAILAELAKHPGRVLTHAHLLRTAWGPAQEGQTEYLRVAVRALRQKLEPDPAHPRLIVNEPSVGYRLVAG